MVAFLSLSCAQAEESLLRVKYAENMKPQKGSLDEARKRLARQLEELG
jgi:hypothetical protein